MATITPPPQTEDFSVLPDPNLIFSFDELLPSWIEAWGDEMMQDFDWKFGQSAYPGGQPFFGQVLKDQETIRQQPWPAIIEIILEAFKRKKFKEIFGEDAVFLETRKILVNGHLPSTPGNPHKDNSNSNAWTLVYHCSDTDGSNGFYSDDSGKELIKEIPFKRGRCTLFPSWYTHIGNPPTIGWRITIAYHIVIDSSLNQKRFLSAVGI